MSLVQLNWTDFEDALIDILESIKYNNGDALQENQQPSATGSKASKLKSVDIFLLGCTGVFTKENGAITDGSCGEIAPTTSISVDGKVGNMLAQMSFPMGEYRAHPSFVSAAATMLVTIAYRNIVELSTAGTMNDDGSSTVTGYATQAGIIIEEGVNRFECEFAGAFIAAGVMNAVSTLSSAETETLPPNFGAAQRICSKLESAMTTSKDATCASEYTNKFSMVLEALALDSNRELLSELKLHRVLDAYISKHEDEEAFADIEIFRKLVQTEEEAAAALDLAIVLSAQGRGGLKVFNRVSDAIMTDFFGNHIKMTPSIKVLLLEIATSLAAQGKMDGLEQHLEDLVKPILEWVDTITNPVGDNNNGEANKDVTDFVECALKLCVRAAECKYECVINKFVTSADFVWNRVGKELGEERSWGVLKKVAELYTASCLHERDLEEMIQKTVHFLVEGMDGSLACDKDAFRIAAEDLLTLSGAVVQRRMDIKSYVHFLESVDKAFAPILDWNSAHKNGVLVGRFMSKVIHGGVKQSLCGENFFKAILFNWLSVFRVVSNMKDKEGRLALMEMFTRVGECMLADASKTEIYMNFAVPLAIRVHGEDATTAAIEETLTGIVTNVDKGLRTITTIKLLYSFDALLKIAEGISCEAQEGVRELFRGLISRGRREDVRLITDTTTNIGELQQTRYRALLEGVMGSQAGPPVPVKLRMSLFRVLSVAIAICLPRPRTGDEEQSKGDNAWAARAVEHVLAPLSALLTGRNDAPGASGRSIKKEDITETLTGLRKVSLFQALFSGDMADISTEGSEAELMARINGRFPEEVLHDQQTMEDLMMLGTRAAQVRNVRPRFIPVLDDLSRALKVLLDGEGVSLGERLRRVHKFLAEQPGNVETMTRLRECGYDPCIWEYDEDRELSMTVEVDLRRNIDYGHKSSLEAVYGEYVDILRRLCVSSVTVPDQEAPVATKMLFYGTQYLTLDAVRARKEAAVQAIEDKLGFKCREDAETLRAERKSSGSVEEEEEYEIHCYYASRVRTLLRREELIDEQYQNERAHAEKVRDGNDKKTFIATLHRSFLGCARCCGNNISGCYAPDGLHAERPIEDGLKAQWGIISLYEGGGAAAVNTRVEIENVEVLLTDQGCYVFKSYTNGHSYDTSMVWIVFFHTLLHSGILPAIIIPNNYPSRPTYATLAQHIQPQLVAAELTFKDPSLDGKIERYTPFYDTPSTFPPDTIRPGDLVLTRDNTEGILDKLNFLDRSKMKTFATTSTAETGASSSPSSSSSPHKRKLRRDLGGAITTEVLEALNKKYPGHTKLVNAIGRPLAAFVADHIQCKAACDTTDIRKVIWNDKGKRIAAKKKKKAKGASESDDAAAAGVLDETAKNKILDDIVSLVHGKLRELYEMAPEDVLCGSNNDEDEEGRRGREGIQRFFEILGHLRGLTEMDAEMRCPQVPSLTDALTLLNAYEDAIRGKIKYQNIGELEGDVRHELMSWIYHNEQKEWISRGGRNRQEMLEDFVVIGSEGRQFPGIVATCEGEGSSTVILGYCIGEFTDAETYEVTCAWVDPRARCLRVASTMYLLVLDCLESTGRAPGAKVCKRLVCDVILGATGRMGFSDFFCRFTMVERRNSWSTGTDSGTTEQFERIVFDFSKVRACYKVFIATKRVCACSAVRTIVKYKKPILIGAGAVGVGLALTLTLRYLKRTQSK